MWGCVSMPYKSCSRQVKIEPSVFSVGAVLGVSRWLVPDTDINLFFVIAAERDDSVKVFPADSNISLVGQNDFIVSLPFASDPVVIRCSVAKWLPKEDLISLGLSYHAGNIPASLRYLLFRDYKINDGPLCDDYYDWDLRIRICFSVCLGVH